MTQHGTTADCPGANRSEQVQSLINCLVRMRWPSRSCSRAMINYRSSTDQQRLPGSSAPRLRTNLSAAKCRAVHTRQRKKLLFVCGGTGGHVFPAIAVAEQVAKLDRNREIDIQFMGADDRDSQPVRIRGFNWIRGPAVRIQRPYLSVRNLVSFFQLLSAIATSIIFMMRFKPDVVLGTGGYVALPACIAAFVCRRPLYLCEPNVVPGVANALLGPLARAVFVAPACLTEKFPKDRVKVESCGVPVRSEFIGTDRDAARAALGVSNDSLLLTVVGGSMGSSEISEALLECAPDLLRTFKHLEIHAQMRGGSMDPESNFTRNKPGDGFCAGTAERFRTTRFFDDMAQQLAASDLVLARAGAGTCAELLQTRVPSILWPLATATDNHQVRNAEWMDQMGVSVVFRPERVGGGARALAGVLASGIRDVASRERMCENAKIRSSGVHASAYIANMILDTAQAAGI